MRAETSTCLSSKVHLFLELSGSPLQALMKVEHFPPSTKDKADQLVSPGQEYPPPKP